jgi:hypothetical protein
MGQVLDGSLFCFNVAKATASDGHDVLQDVFSRAQNYRINSVSPSAGTSVSRTEAVTVQVAPVDQSQPPASRPCDWVTTDEAAKFLGTQGTQGVTTMPMGDQAGSVDQMCDYSGPDQMVVSELQLPGSMPMDASTAFAMAQAKGAGSDVAGLPGRAHCTPSASGTADSPAMLVVLLQRQLRCSQAIRAGRHSPDRCLTSAVNEPAEPPRQVVPDRRHTRSQTHPDVAPRAQGGWQRRQPGQPAGQLEHLLGDGKALGAVCVEHRVGGSVEHPAQRLGQRDRVLDPEVHALATCRAVNVCGVARQQQPAVAVAVGDPMMDPEMRSPDEVGH